MDRVEKLNASLKKQGELINELIAIDPEKLDVILDEFENLNENLNKIIEELGI